MQLSVVIPTHQRPQALRELLVSLTDQEYALDSLEIHVVSNFHADPSQDVVRDFQGLLPGLQWHAVGLKGSNRARNMGLHAATGDVVLFLDDDCYVPHRYFLRDLLLAHEEHADVVAIGGAYITPPDATSVEKVYAHISTVWLARRTEDADQHINLVGGNVSYKRSQLHNLGLEFNEEIAFGGAETDLHIRIYKAGGKLVFLEHLNIEHRPRLSGPELLRKGFLQGLAAHVRWQNGLIVPTRSRLARKQSMFRVERFWANAFEMSFRLGGMFGRWSGGKKPNAVRVILFLGTHSSRSLLAAGRDRFKRWAFLKSFLSSERRLQVGLPMSRFYFLSVSEECAQDCSYSGKLGCRKPVAAGGIAQELKKAKAYGFKEVLLPCNIYFLKNKREIVAQIANAGLRPMVLVNGDERASIPQEYLHALAAVGCEFHLLLGAPSEYQDGLISMLTADKREISATYLHQGWREGLSILKNAPASMAHRTHYLFPAGGDVWHPHPSCVEIQRFLQKVVKVRARSSSTHVRGPAGYWPIDRGAQAQPDPWPDLEPDIEWGTRPSAPLFSVVIPTFDSSEHLVKVLRSLEGQTLRPEQFEVIVVDDGSRDRTAEILRSKLGHELHPQFYFRYFYWPRPAGQLHFRAGLVRNLGVSHSSGTYLCFLDSDILVPPDYLEDLRQGFNYNDVIQARRDMLTLQASEASRGYAKFKDSDVYRDSDYWEDFKATEAWSHLRHYWKYTCTYALSLRRDLFFRAGWFSPEFFSYGFEDVDLGYRCAKLGARFQLSQKAVYHLYPSRSELTYHFDEKERTRALTLSSRVLYRNRLDPEIFDEFYPAYFQPFKGEMKIFASRAYWRVRNSLVEARWRFLPASLSDWCAGRIEWCIGKMEWCAGHVWAWIVRTGWLGVRMWWFAVRAWWYVVRAWWWTWAQIIVPILKPYYFVRFQIQKRFQSESRSEVSRVES